MRLLLSIKPQFANLIFTGEKRYEFRKAIFRRNDVDTVVVYASYPVCKVIGEFRIDEVVEDELDRLWRKTREFAGISKEFFFEYFSNRPVGYAIKVKSYKSYKRPYNLEAVHGIKPPQSFAYIVN
jgi:predicted transcriptional regulator